MSDYTPTTESARLLYICGRWDSDQVFSVEAGREFEESGVDHE